MRIFLVFLSAFTFSCSIFSANDTVFRCENVLPLNIQVPALKMCNQNIVYIPAAIEEQYKTSYFDAYLTEQILRNNNIGASIFNLPNHRQKTIYRSANLAGSPLCLHELFTDRHVDTIINLIDNSTAHCPLLKALEADEFRVIGGKSYIHFSDYVIAPGLKIVKEKLFKTITAIIMRVVQSNGNVLIHCLAGEHDTAVIFGIMQKCYNKLPLEVIYKNTLCHLPPMEYQYLRDAYKIVSQTIEDYPCSLLDQ